MKPLQTRIVTLLMAALLALPGAATANECAGQLLDHDVRLLAEDKSLNLCETYKNSVVLVVNSASRCGNTPQYSGLEALYEKYRSQGLVVLGFPSNDFAGQEPGTEAEIQNFCRTTYDIRFPMFEKSVVKGDGAHPLFVALGAQSEMPQWNFHKYLIGRDGKFLRSFTPGTQPQAGDVVAAIEAALAGSDTSPPTELPATL